MAVENKQYSANDLDRVKYTPESTKDNSVVQVRLTEIIGEQRAETEKIVHTLEEIKEEMIKLNTYFALIMEGRL